MLCWLLHFQAISSARTGSDLAPKSECRILAGHIVSSEIQPINVNPTNNY
jgi:hypothetical protein